MKKYLKDLPNKSPEHKKRFALLASGSFTVVMFAIWAVVKFGGAPDVVVENTGPVNLAAVATAESEIAPFESLYRGMRDTWNSITEILNDAE